MTKLHRRHFLKSAAAVSAASFTSTIGSFAARAADTTGYKALVCVFLKGGMDCHDTVLPYDQSSYDSYTNLRQQLMGIYNALPAGQNRARSQLLPLSPTNSGDFGGRQFALPPEMAGLHDLFARGKASIVGNVGPLITPIDRTAYREDRSLRPDKLFSHNDQQATWMSLSAEGQGLGWGGRFADAALLANANANPVFTAISVAGNEVFLSGQEAVQFQIDSGGTDTIRELENDYLLRGAQRSVVAEAILEDHFRGTGFSGGNFFERDIAAISSRAIDSNKLCNDTLESIGDFVTPFPESGLGRQLSTVAKTIGARNSLGAARQVFFVSMGGFDTHSTQAQKLPGLQAQINDAVAAFYAATEELGIENDVTLFTASDFGRTLIINGDGSDHGWGAHHFVVGGAVNGGQIYGDVPPMEVDHSQDAGRGRLIPTTSIEQFAAPLGRWFGLNESELSTALPNLSAFTGSPTFV